MITKIKQMRRGLESLRRDLKLFYVNKYYNIFMNRYKFPTLDYQQQAFILRRFWDSGKIAGFVIKEVEGIEGSPYGLAVFCDFAPAEYNIYDFPTKATLINKRGVKFIPYTLQEIDKDIVIGYIQRNEKPVKQFVDLLVDKIVECEMSIYQNLKAVKTPLMVTASPEDEQAFKNILEYIDESRTVVFIPSEYAERVKVLNNTSAYIIDKLYNYRTALENELREFLGLDNLGFAEKKEHLLNQEIEQNDQVTETSGNIFYDCLVEFGERFEDVFGYPLPVILADVEDKADEPQDETKEEEETQDEAY